MGRVMSDGYTHSDKDLISHVLDARRILLKGDRLETTIARAFGIVGEALRVDRVYLFEIHVNNEHDVCASQRYEWCASGVTAQIDNPDLHGIPLYESGYTRWLDHFQAYKPVHGPVSSFPESERAILQAQGIQSLLILPVFTGGSLYGFVGFDDCSHKRHWTDTELSALFILTISLGWVLMDLPQTQADRAVSNAISFIDRMMKVQTMTLDAAPLATHLERTASRLAAATEVHRFLAETMTEGCIEAIELLQRLEQHFTRVLNGAGATDGRIVLRADDTVIGVREAVSVTLLATEILSACAVRGLGSGDQQLLIELASVQDRAEFRIRQNEDAAVPDEQLPELDAMALIMIRNLIEELGGSRVTDSGTPALVWIRFSPHCS